VSRSLNPKQELFALEYLKDLNATQAAIRAGYSERTADRIGSRLLGNVGVASRVREALEERKARVKVEADEVLAELLICLRSSVADYEVSPEGRIQLSDGARPEQIRAISGVKRRVKRYVEGKGEDAEPVEVEEIEYKLWDKVGTANLLGKHLGLFPDRHQLEGKDGKELAAPVVNVIIGDGSPTPSKTG
jgi:phage terminase small subunit